mgnify:CR=1 FL=1
MKTAQEIIAAAQSLSPAERLQLVEAIWDSLLNTPEAIPVPDWHREVHEHAVEGDIAWLRTKGKVYQLVDVA